MPVRTEQFYCASTTLSAGSDFTLYTCPSGKTAIIRSIRIHQPNSSTQTLTLRVRPSGAGSSFVVRTIVLAQNASLEEEVWCVLSPGDILAIRSANAFTAGLWVSGAELEGVST